MSSTTQSVARGQLVQGVERASAPLSSPPWTLPATHRTAGVSVERGLDSAAPVAERVAQDLRGSSRMAARPSGVTRSASPTIA